MVAASDILAARERLAGYLRPTPFEHVPQLGANVWLKLECANRTHSFKIRGALNAMLSLDEAAKARGIVTASSGNHAQGVAYAAHLLGLPAKILMPSHTPKRKIDGVRCYGAEVVLFGSKYDETELEGRRLERDEGLTFVSPYNDERVIAGAGTIGLEILDDLPEVERVIVPASGCGLISGIGLAIKNHSKAIEVVGVNALSSPELYNWLYGDQRPQIWETLAEALSGEIEVGSITFDLSKQVVDQCMLVTEDQIANAMHWLMVNAGWIVEGGGAVGVAALLGGVLPLDDRPTAVVISGGNVDEATLRRVLGS